jgi:predicted AAA+ superfamily ATPase
VQLHQQMTTTDYIRLESEYGAHNYHPIPVVLTKGLGVHVWDVDGNKYLDFLTNSYILYSVPRYNIKGKELLSRNEKYYVVDLGLKNIVNTNKFDSDLGHKLENVIYFELLKRGGLVYTGNFNGKEIDFVVQKPNNEREYYQVAFTVSDQKTLKREISALQQIRDNYPKYLLTMDPDQDQIEGIIKLNIIDWLLQI